MFEIII